MFHHPKYYKELRKRNRELRASTASPSVPQSDQVISSKPATAGTSVHLVRASSSKQQASSVKLQAPSCKRQAPSWY